MKENSEDKFFGDAENNAINKMIKRNSTPLKRNFLDYYKDKNNIKTYSEFCKTELAKQTQLTEDEITYYNNQYKQEVEEEKDLTKDFLKDSINIEDTTDSINADLSGFYYGDNISYKNTGKLVRNTRSNRVGVVLREFETGQIEVLEKIQPHVINTHDSWNTLELLED